MSLLTSSAIIVFEPLVYWFLICFFYHPWAVDILHREIIPLHIFLTPLALSSVFCLSDFSNYPTYTLEQLKMAGEKYTNNSCSYFNSYPRVSSESFANRQLILSATHWFTLLAKHLVYSLSPRIPILKIKNSYRETFTLCKLFF